MPRSVSEAGPRGGEAEGRKKHLPEKTFEPAVAPPPPSATTPAGAEHYAEAHTVATVTPEGEYIPGPAAPSEHITGPSPAQVAHEKRVAKRKERRRYLRHARKVTNITKTLNFDRERRAKSYEQDFMAEAGNKFFEHNPDGSIKQKTVHVPVIKTSEKKIKLDEQKYHKTIRKLQISGVKPAHIAALKKAAAEKVIQDNYVVGKNGKVATEQHVVPVVKPHLQAKLDHEIAKAHQHVHAIREGSKNYFFQSKVSKAQENQILGQLAKQRDEHSSGGFLGITDPVGAVVSNVPVVGPAIKAGLDATGVNLTKQTEEDYTNANKLVGKGLGYLTSTYGKATGLSNKQASAAGFGGQLPNISALREGTIHGIHNSLLTGTEYLTRPGLIIEQGIGQAAGVGGDPWQALLHGHSGKGVVSGAQISKKLFGGPQGGLLIDFATDPTLWVGAGEVKIAEGEQLAALTSRIAKSDPAILADESTAKLVQDAADGRRDAGSVLGHLEDLAQENGVSLSRLGKTKDDRTAIQDRNKALVKRQEETMKQDFAIRSGKADEPKLKEDVKKAEQRFQEATKSGNTKAYERAADDLSQARDRYLRNQEEGNPAFVGGKSRQAAVEEAGRREAENKVLPGLRINISTPFGKHLGSVDLKLPKALEDKHITFGLQNKDELLALRKSKARATAFQSHDAEITDALDRIKAAKTPEEARKAKADLADAREALTDSLNRAEANVYKGARRTPAENAALKTSRRYGHETFRTARAQGESVYHRQFENAADALRGLKKKEREQVAMHLRETQERAGPSISDRLYPLNEKQQAALKKYRQVQFENARYGLEVGTIPGVTKDYIPRDVTSGPDPLEGRAEVPTFEQADQMRKSAMSNPDKSRGYAATSDFTNRRHFAEQLRHVSHDDLSMEEALKLADEWQHGGTIKTIQEDLVHAAQRGAPITEQDATNLQREALSWGTDRGKGPKIFKNPEKTEGQFLPHEDAFKPEAGHNFTEAPFDHLSEEAATKLKRETAQEDLRRLEDLRDRATRPEVKDELAKMVEARAAEVRSYGGHDVGALRERLKSVEKLADRPGTAGEGQAAAEAAKKLKAQIDEASAFIPGNPSEEYLGTLRDMRKDHPQAYAILDPLSGDYHRALTEDARTAYHLRWKAAAKRYGRKADDPSLRSPDGIIFYDKKTGEEFIVPDTAFQGALDEGTLLPSQLHSDLRAEFFRLGENVNKGMLRAAESSLHKVINSFNSSARYGLTTLFPAYTGRNVVSDLMNSELADPSGHLFHPIMNAKLSEVGMTGGKGLVKEIKVPGWDEPVKSEDFLFMMDVMGLKNQMHLAEVVELATKGKLDDPAEWYRIDKKHFPLSRKGFVGKRALKYTSRREDLPRMKTFIQRMRRNGGDAADAAWHTIKYHFDYGDLSWKEKEFARNTFMFYCVPDDHEILTQDGFKKKSELADHETVLTINPKTREIEWQNIKGVAEFDYDDEIWAFDRRSGSIEFTPNHRWLTEDGKLTPAYELNTARRIPLTGDYRGADSVLSPRLAAILGWVVTDGHWSVKDGKYHDMRVYQSPGKHLDEVETLLGNTGYVPNPTSGVVPVKVLRDDIDAIRAACPTKDDIVKVVGRLSREAAEAMYGAMIKAEGSKGPNHLHFAQNPGPVLEAFQMLVHLVGKTGSVSKRGLYVRGENAAIWAKDGISKRHYKGTVWCPQTPNETWFVRSPDGTVAPTGNTWYRKNIPLQFLSLVQKPGFFSALTNTQIELAQGGTPFNFNWNKLSPILPDLSGPVPNSALIPSYMGNSMAAPEVNWNGHAVALSLGLPWSDMNVVTNALENPEEGIRSVFNLGTPLLRLASELGFEQSLLTGQKMEGQTHTTWSDLFKDAGIGLPKNDEGQPLLPWQVSTVLNNIFPAVGRSAGYLKPPSSVEDQGNFSTLFGGGLGTLGTGISAYVGPKEGERLDKAYVYKVYERVEQREAVANSGKNKKAVEADLKKFDNQTGEWAKDVGVPEKYLKVVQGLGPKWFVSKSDRKLASETSITGNEEGGLLGSGATGGLWGSSGGSALEPSTFTPPSKEYKSSTEEAIDLLPQRVGAQGFGLLKGYSEPAESKVESAIYNLHANEKLEHKLKTEGKTAAAKSLPAPANPKAPGKAPHSQARAWAEAAAKGVLSDLPKIPKGHEPKGTPQDIKKATASIGKWLEKSPHGKEPKEKDLKVTAPKHKRIQVLKNHYLKAKEKVASEGKATIGELSSGKTATEFAEWFAHYSGMDPAVAAGWVQAEGAGESGNTPGEAGKDNWLAARYPGSPTAFSTSEFNEGPKAAAKKTVEWMAYQAGNDPENKTSPGIHELYQKLKSRSLTPEQQILAIGESGWLNGVEHEPSSAQAYMDNIKTGAAAAQVTPAKNVNPVDRQHLKNVEAKLKSFGVDPASLAPPPEGGDYKVVHSRQQAKTVIHLANKFTGTQEGSALQQHWAAMAGVSAAEPWCSSFLAALMRRVGLPEPSAPAAAGTWQQWSGGKRLGTTDPNALKPGDIITFGESDPTGDYADHVGLYIGNGEMISGNFGNEVRRGPLSEEERPIQAIIQPKYSGKKVSFKLSTTPTTSSGGEAVSGAPVASQGGSTGSSVGNQEALSGAEAQGTPGYHPGRSKEAIQQAKKMRANVTAKLSPGTFSTIKPTDVSSYGKGVLTTAAKARAEVEQAERGETSLTRKTSRKPKFKR